MSPVIVIGFDGSESSLKAVTFAKGLAKTHKASLNLVHVIDWSPFEYYTLEETATQARKRRTQIQQDRESLFPAVLADLKKSGVRAGSRVVFGNPAQVLARAAKNVDALMIVVGRQGTSKIRRLLLGGVANAVISHASCPVLVVP